MQMQINSPKPVLSVVVVILGGRVYVPRCLEALMRQEGIQDLEIVVPYDDRIPDVPTLQAKFPAVRFLPIQGRRTYAELRAIGVGHARGEVVALTEDHCIPNAQWCARILEAHVAPHAAVGGVVDKGATDQLLNWAVYLCDFSRYMSPVREGPADYLTDCNVTYKTGTLALIRDLWKESFHETTVHWALQNRGETLWLSPRIAVYQQRNLRFKSALHERYAFGRLFASTRVAAVSPARRAAFAGLSWLLPLYLSFRVTQNVFRKRRHRGIFVKALPLVLGLNLVWAWGEFIGYVTGRPPECSVLQTDHAFGVAPSVR